MDAHVRNGRLVKVTSMREHPLSKLCFKGRQTPQWLYSQERITAPLRKANGTWQKISLDEAFEIIAEKLTSIREDRGARALVTHLGFVSIGTHSGRLASRFCSLYGTPNFTSAASFCFAARGLGHGLTVSNRMLPLMPSYSDSTCVVVWGYNPEESNLIDAPHILTAKRRGAKIIVIDPRVTPLAKKADIYLQIRPGTDCALALGLLNVIVSEQLYDGAFVDRWTVGFDKLKEHIKDYSPEVVERITWIPAQTIREVARTYATSKPAAIAQGVSLDHSVNGVQTSRATSILIAITGNLDMAGGNIYNRPLKLTSLRIPGAVSPEEAVGAHYPLFGKFTSETTAVPIPGAIITGKPYPIKALIVQGSNLVLTWPNTSKVKEALGKLDLLVVSDLFMTETAELADVFLPAASSLEQEMLRDYTFEGLPLAMLGGKAIEPPGDSIEDWRLWSELGRKMGYANYFPWQSSIQVIADLLRPSGITVEQLRQNSGGILHQQPDRKQKYREDGLSTASGKVEIFSQIMADHGYDPLPTFHEPANALPLADSYPFTLVAGSRTRAFTHSQYRNIARLRELIPQPVVEINRDQAIDLDITNGEEVRIESPKGNIKLQARLTPDIHPSVLSLQHRWAQANANLLTDDETLDPISAYPPFKAVMCRLTKAG
jgi:anaerobic selenocysteine-containing dehydrogenase